MFVVNRLGPYLFLFILSFLCISITHADEPGALADASLETLKSLSIEELQEIPVVYGASKHDQKVTEAPSSISIVTADEIKKFGHRTLADILRSVRGFYTNYDRNYSYTGVRGINRPGDYGGRILILIDGHRFNDPLYDGSATGFEFILDVDLIDRVEIIRGPGSSLYGNNAFFAVINVITRKGRDMEGVELAGKARSYDTYETRASYGRRFENGLELLLSGSYLESDGHEKLYFKEFDQPENNHGIAEGIDDESAYRLFGSFAFEDFTLRGAFMSREKTVPTGSFGTVFNDPNFVTLDEYYFVELAYAHQFADDLDVKARLYYDWYGYEGTYPYIWAPGDPIILNADDDAASWGGGELQVSKRLFTKHRVTAGIEYRDDYQLTHRNFDLSPFTEYDGIDTSAQTYSFYIQDEYAILPELTINAGLRYDYFSFLGDTINPRVAAIYHPWEETTFKLLYGEAFRAPNVFERAYAASPHKANPNLQPETISTYELIWEQYLPYNLRLSLSGFYNQIEGLISQRLDKTDNHIFYDNISNVDTKGLDFELEGKTDSGWLGRMSYTWQHSEDKDAGTTLNNSPAHLVKFNLLAPLYQDKLFAGLELQYSSSVKTLSGNTADGYWLTNVQLFSQRLVPGLEISGGVFNLFDHEYGLPGGEEHRQDVIGQDGRTFQVTLRYRF